MMPVRASRIRRALGISHLYLSPILEARTGSTHGYDVADPTHVSTALGGGEALIALATNTHDTKRSADVRARCVSGLANTSGRRCGKPR